MSSSSTNPSNPYIFFFFFFFCMAKTDDTYKPTAKIKKKRFKISKLVNTLMKVPLAKTGLEHRAFYFIFYF